jgi:hypothetical protein
MFNSSGKGRRIGEASQAGWLFHVLRACFLLHQAKLTRKYAAEGDAIGFKRYMEICPYYYRRYLAY